MFFSKTRFILSIIIGILLSTMIVGMGYYYSYIDTADTKEDITRVEKHVAELLNSLSEGSLQWSDIDNIGMNPDFLDLGHSRLGRKLLSYLSDYNRQIAMARVKVKTSKYLSDPNTIEQSHKKYKIRSEVLINAVFIGFLSLILTIPFSLLMLYIVTVLWGFILNRISELSNAIQGKR